VRSGATNQHGTTQVANSDASRFIKMESGTTIASTPSKITYRSPDGIQLFDNWQGHSRMTILTSGNVGFGTDTPQNSVDIGGNLAIGASYAGVSVAPLNSMIVQGNVGIGTTNPGAKLEVVGNVKIADGTQGAGKVLTSDANGLATWATVTGVSHTIGESYGGGIVFYVYDGGQHGLIAATTDQSTGIRWYGGTNTNTRGRADGVGAGKANTAIIIANQAPVDGAAFSATVCNEYSVTAGGVTYGDWYLPSKHELNLLYLQKTVVGGFSNGAYWSSTEGDASDAWGQSFTSGAQANNGKNGTLYIRAVRAF
jgi:hypothetical protein